MTDKQELKLWRDLAVGEVTKEGDRFFNPRSGKWCVMDFKEIGCPTELTKKHFPHQREVIRPTEQLIKSALTLLDAAICPQCGDKSGAYYTNDGDVCQCQWCCEVSELRVLLEPQPPEGE